jgi:hypothetical protein
MVAIPEYSDILWYSSNKCIAKVGIFAVSKNVSQKK